MTTDPLRPRQDDEAPPLGAPVDAVVDEAPVGTAVAVDEAAVAAPVGTAVPAPEARGGIASAAALAELEDTLFALLSLPSETGREGPIADWLVGRAADRPLRRIGHSLVVGDLAATDDRELLLLVGHTDTVPATDADREPRREGEQIIGRGASDMKSGLAVALSVLEDDELADARYRVVLVAYAGEEGSHAGNELGAVLAEVPQLADAALAVVLEPTDLTVQLGCLGALHAEVRFTGQGAHAARPWQGRNALTRAGVLLSALDSLPPTDVEVDGLVYREVITATQAWTGADDVRARNARNVVPDRFTINLNYRFAPGRTVGQAEDRLRELVGPLAEVFVTDRAPAAPPSRHSPAVATFIASAQADVAPKQAWTDVARFAEIGVPALNFGPGLTAQAHQAGEYVRWPDVVAAREVLARILVSPPVT